MNIQSHNAFAAVTVARSRIDFYFSQRLRQQQQKLQEHVISGHVTLGDYYFVQIVRQVARNIAQCNSIFKKSVSKVIFNTS